MYVLEAGAVDRQQPHTEDEVYVVLDGRARFTAGDETGDVGPGDTMFVAADVPHRFHDITQSCGCRGVRAGRGHPAPAALSGSGAGRRAPALDAVREPLGAERARAVLVVAEQHVRVERRRRGTGPGARAHASSSASS